MSESGDYTPAPYWQGHDFKSAWSAYDQKAGRDYQDAQAKGLTANKLLPERISTQSGHPFIIDTDFTGSMDGWDNPIASKFPILDHEVRTEYLGEDMEISFGAICDTGDEYPLQIRPFAKGAGMKTELDKLVHASGGSGPGNYCEAHGLAVLYRLRNTDTPKALIKPPYIIVTDEMPFSRITQEEAMQYAKVKIEKAMTREEIFEEAGDTYSMYVVLKPYGSERLQGDTLPRVTQEVYNCWEKIIGAGRIALLPEADRIVDVIFGLLAQDTGRVDYFRKEIEARQRPDQVETVYKSLKTVHMLPKPDTQRASSGHSKTKGLGGGTPTKPLI